MAQDLQDMWVYCSMLDTGNCRLYFLVYAPDSAFVWVLIRV